MDELESVKPVPVTTRARVRILCALDTIDVFCWNAI